jgi:hypothetical protein
VNARSVAVSLKPTFLQLAAIAIEPQKRRSRRLAPRRQELNEKLTAADANKRLVHKTYGFPLAAP